MTPSALPSFPKIRPIEPTPIPYALKGAKRWFPWRAGPIKANGKFDKIPVDPLTGRNVSPLDPKNWLTFPDALDAYRNGVGDGLGIALSAQHPITIAGSQFYLIAIDLDNCGDRMDDHQALWRQLGQPYVEASPSGNGLRMLGLSRTLVRSGNAGDGREMYANKHFVTVTGNAGRGALCDFTNGVVALELQWFGSAPAPQAPTQPRLGQPARPEHPVFVAPVLSMLDAVSSDTDYETWRAIIYAVASTDWKCARHLVHIWSRKAPHRYDAAALDKLFESFDPSRGITLATLVFHARKNGWTDRPAAVLHMQPQSPISLLMTADQLRQLPTTPYVVRNMFPAQGLAAIYGEPGSGKSFLALHLAHAIATGAGGWFGFSVRQMPVVYVALEGMGGIGRRTTALELHSKRPCPDQLRFWCRDIHLLTGDGIDFLASEVAAAVGMGAVVIVDTLNQASPGADENGSQDMGRIIASTKRLAAAVGGLVILVHHAGKNRSLGLRGHSSLLAALDAVIEVSKTPSGHKKWSITKAKDDSSDIERDFDLISYVVGQDDCGPVTSCAVQHTIHTTPSPRRKPSGKHQKAALELLRRHLQPGSAIDYRAVLTLVAPALDAPQSKKSERAKEAVDALLRDGHLLLNEMGVSLA